MYFADTTTNEGCPIFRALCERWERRNSTTAELHRSSNLSSVIPSAARSSARGRSCGVEGPAFLPTLGSNHPAASPSRGQIAGLSTPGTDSRASPFPPLKMTISKRRNSTNNGLTSDELSNGCVRPPKAVILRQRSPWQSQELPTKDLAHED
jgi:hypothetical protein